MDGEARGEASEDDGEGDVTLPVSVGELEVGEELWLGLDEGLRLGPASRAANADAAGEGLQVARRQACI